MRLTRPTKRRSRLAQFADCTHYRIQHAEIVCPSDGELLLVQVNCKSNHHGLPIVTHRHKFIIEAIDPETDCVAHDALFGVDDLNDIRAQLNLDEFDPREVYELDESDIDRLKSRYAVSFRANGLTTVLRPWIWVDDLPYKVHTNRELALMLAGSKPLAVFCDVYPSDFADEIIPETLYEPHVRSGRFLKRECIREYRSQRATTTARQLRTVL